MREIKFKALRNGFWVYFDFSNSQIWAKDLLRSMADGDTRVSFDTPFLEFTGLRDKNGVEIFEGDIVGDSDVWGKHWIRVVKFEDGEFTPLSSYYHLEMGCLRPEEMEVIGNVHQHPELLK